MIRLGIYISIAALLAGCFSQPTSPAPKRGPVTDSAPRLARTDLLALRDLPDPVVRAEPKSRGGNGPVYTVLGKRYRVMDDARGFVQTGTASWYGAKFHGRNTSNGERFDMYRLTAAHKHLPIPSFVRVTNLANQRTTIVRVNDRGPFHEDRIIDLSYAAAVKLGFHDQGTARVKVEVLQPKSKAKAYMIQAGAYREFATADAGLKRLRSMLSEPVRLIKSGSDGLYRLQIGPIDGGAPVDRISAILEGSEFGKPRLIEVR